MISKRNSKYAAAAVVLALLVACASVGTGDPVVVRAEDALTNGLSVYTNAMNWHFANSKTESPQVYKVFESFRVNFPAAWNTLDAAKRQYQKDKTAGAATVDAAINALQVIVASVLPYLPTGGK